MNHGINCPHLYLDDGKTLRDVYERCPMDPIDPIEDAPEACEDCELSDCRTCGRTIRRCGAVREGCEFCTPFDPEELTPCAYCRGTRSMDTELGPKPCAACVEQCDECGNPPHEGGCRVGCNDKGTFTL